MRMAARCFITVQRRSSAPSTRPAANSTASSVTPSADHSSYPQIPRTRQESREKIEAPLNDLTKGHQGNVDIVARRKHMPLGSTPPLRSHLPVQLTNMDLEPRRSLTIQVTHRFPGRGKSHARKLRLRSMT